MKKNKWVCKVCGFKATGPTGLGNHYREFPDHRSRASQNQVEQRKRGHTRHFDEVKKMWTCPTCKKKGSSQWLGGHYVQHPDHRTKKSVADKKSHDKARRARASQHLAPRTPVESPSEPVKAVSSMIFGLDAASKWSRTQSVETPTHGVNFCPHCGMDLKELVNLLAINRTVSKIKREKGAVNDG